MRVILRIVFVLYILFGFYSIAQEKKSPEPSAVLGAGKAKLDTNSPAPKLTDAQKLEIRTAQVEMFQAKTILEQTPQFKAFMQAQDNMNQIALRIQRSSGADPSKWTLTQDLEYVAVPQPAKEKK